MSALLRSRYLYICKKRLCPTRLCPPLSTVKLGENSVYWPKTAFLSLQQRNVQRAKKEQTGVSGYQGNYPSNYVFGAGF